MLQAISWQQYVTAVFLITTLWYGYVGIKYYRKEILSFLRIDSSVKNSLVPPVASHSVMGQVRHDDHVITQPEEELIISASSVSDEISDQTIPRGPSDDLFEEACALVNAYQDNNDKTSFLAMLHALLDRYELQRDEISLTDLSNHLQKFAQAILPFSLSKQQWAFKWPEH